MRKKLAIAVIAVHLLGNTELGQLFKLPELISHYFQHHRQDPGINFFEFLAMHYGGDDGTDADDKEDNELPCHNPNTHSLSYSYTAFLKTPANMDALNLPEEKIFGGRLQNGNPSEHVLLILQPPRQS